ncbi:IclR family transcriptional regulator [Rhodococcus sp. NPDC004095]
MTVVDIGQWQADAPRDRTSAAAREGRRESMLERMTRIIDAFDDPNEGLGLEDVTTRTGLPRSTVHRIMVELLDLGWIGRDGREYRLGARALGAVGPQATHARIRMAAGNIVQELYLRTGLVVHLGVLEGGREHFLDKVGGPFALAIRSRVGSSLAAHRGTGGRAMLATLAPEKVDRLVRAEIDAGERLDGWTLSSLHRELNRIRGAAGIAVQRSETNSGIADGGIASVASAVRAGDGTVVSLCAAGQAHKVRLDQVAPLVKDATNRLAVAL